MGELTRFDKFYFLLFGILLGNLIIPLKRNKEIIIINGRILLNFGIKYIIIKEW